MLRVYEDFVYPFSADIGRCVFYVGYYFDIFDHFAGTVPIAENDTCIVKIVQVICSVEDSGNRVLIRHQNHGTFSFVLIDASDYGFPENADQIAKNQVEPGGQVKGDTGIGVTSLGGEEVEGHNEKDKNHMFDRFDQFLQISAFHHVM